MGSLSRKCLAHRVYACNVLLPPALTPALPSDSWACGPRAASASPAASAFSRLLTVSAFSSVLHGPLRAGQSCHPTSLTCFAGVVGYTVATALSDAVYRKRWVRGEGGKVIFKIAVLVPGPCHVVYDTLAARPRPAVVREESQKCLV